MKNTSSEITPEHIYLSRRRFLKSLGLFAAGAGITAGLATLEGCVPVAKKSGQSQSNPTAGNSTSIIQASQTPTSAVDNSLTSFDDITNYTNFYEFSLSKSDVADFAGNFHPDNWMVEIAGLVNNPKSYDLDDLHKLFDSSENIYRMRCVEGWSMVIPWDGFPLAKLLAVAEPTSSAKYVHFISLNDPQQMPGQKSSMFSWPYEEGLRLDEAMNDLTLLATGIYGKPLPPQNGAPIRLVVPWKYGFKSIKSIVKIELVADLPKTFWAYASPQEYGFYANVNPDVDHPRWSQRNELRFGLNKRIPTQLFNGYADQVAAIYQDMDLIEYY